MKRNQIGNNTDPHERRYWLDVTYLNFDFDYLRFLKYLRECRGKNIIENVSLSLCSKTSKIKYIHFNFVRDSLKQQPFNQEFPGTYTCTFNGHKLTFKENPNRRPYDPYEPEENPNK